MSGKWLAFLTLTAGLAIPGASTLSAQDWRGIRHDRQDLRGDYARLEAMRADMARDQARLNEDIRRGRSWQAERDARDLARDRRAFEAQQRDSWRDRQDLHRDWR